MTADENRRDARNALGAMAEEDFGTPAERYWGTRAIAYALLSISEQLAENRAVEPLPPEHIRCAVCEQPVSAAYIWKRDGVGAGHAACVNTEAERLAATSEAP